MACSAPQIETQNANASTTTGSSSSGSTAIVSRPPRFTMEGVGARVIRGPDWKWGKQVNIFSICMWCAAVVLYATLHIKCATNVQIKRGESET